MSDEGMTENELRAVEAEPREREFAQREREIIGEYGGRLVEIGASHNEKADALGSRMNGYMFAAHGAIVSLSLTGLSAEKAVVPTVELKACFTASAVALVLLSVDLALGSGLLRQVAKKYFETSQEVFDAGLEDPPRHVYMSDQMEKEVLQAEQKFGWLAQVASGALAVELGAVIWLMWV